MALVYPLGTILCIGQVLDPSGTNPKDRFIVLVRDLDSADPLLFGVAITSSFSYPLPPTSVKMPVQKSGTRCRTGLTKPCIADCTWIVEATPSDILGKKVGFTPPIELDEIMRQVPSYLAVAMARPNTRHTQPPPLPPKAAN